MHKRILKSFLALILCLTITFSVSISLISCSSNGGDNSDNGNASDPSSEGETPSDTDYHNKVKVPEYKDYERDTIDFSDLSYTRPDYAKAIDKFTQLVTHIEENKLSFDEQLQEILDLEDIYNDVRTMYAVANIYNSKDNSVEFWNTEYSYVTSNYPAFAQVVEKLFVAAANSPHAEKFEEEYFGDGLIEEYKDGGKFTDEMIAFWTEEEALEAEYSSLSAESITITYNGVTDTVENLLNHYKEKYGESSRDYLSHSALISAKYKEKIESEYLRIFISLIKVRKNIASELGYSSYLEHGYETLGRDYSGEQASEYLDDIAEYIVPVYNILSLSTFIPYFYPDGIQMGALAASTATLDEIINNGYELLGGANEELNEAYSYMLQHKLYDIELSKENRKSGAFTTYLNTYNAPFIFISAHGNITDYSTLFHEFGHFYDAYVNYNSSASIDQKEISSQALEYLMLLKTEGKLSKKDQLYLKYTMLWDALETFVIQGFYAKSEELIYALDYEDITVGNINAAIKDAAKMFELDSNNIDISYFYSIPHLYIYPYYVQSYAVSIAPALEMYFLERDSEGVGFDAYLKMVDRNEEDTMTLIESIEDSGLTSPFEKNYLRFVANKIYSTVMGKDYYPDDTFKNNINAA